MRRAIVIADSGAALAALTRALVDIDAEIVRYASGRSSVERLVHGFAPDLVLVHGMGWPPLALARLAEVRRAAPGAAIVVLAEQIEADWLADALRMGAGAVMPAAADPETMRQVIGEVLAHAPVAAA